MSESEKKNEVRWYCPGCQVAVPATEIDATKAHRACDTPASLSILDQLRCAKCKLEIVDSVVQGKTCGCTLEREDLYAEIVRLEHVQIELGNRLAALPSSCRSSEVTYVEAEALARELYEIEKHLMIVGGAKAEDFEDRSWVDVPKDERDFHVQVAREVLLSRQAAVREAFGGWEPTPEAINGLPPALRSFIHELETRVDPEGEIAARVRAQGQLVELAGANAELGRELARWMSGSQAPSAIEADVKALVALAGKDTEEYDAAIRLQLWIAQAGRQIESDAKSIESLRQAVERPCSITGMPFFMLMAPKEEGGEFEATYGGPYNSYTVPRKDERGNWSRVNYDHDTGSLEHESVSWIKVSSDEEDELEEARELGDKWKTAAMILWGFLDDIDTASDIAKGNMEVYLPIVARAQKNRFAILSVGENDSLHLVDRNKDRGPNVVTAGTERAQRSGALFGFYGDEQPRIVRAEDIAGYAREQGWDVTKLTTRQLVEAINGGPSGLTARLATDDLWKWQDEGGDVFTATATTKDDQVINLVVRELEAGQFFGQVFVHGYRKKEHEIDGTSVEDVKKRLVEIASKGYFPELGNVIKTDFPKMGVSSVTVEPTPAGAVWTGIPKSARGDEKQRVRLPEEWAQRCDEQRVQDIKYSANTAIGGYEYVNKMRLELTPAASLEEANDALDLLSPPGARPPRVERWIWQSDTELPDAFFAIGQDAQGREVRLDVVREGEDHFAGGVLVAGLGLTYTIAGKTLEAVKRFVTSFANTNHPAA